MVEKTPRRHLSIVGSTPNTPENPPQAQSQQVPSLRDRREEQARQDVPQAEVIIQEGIVFMWQRLLFGIPPEQAQAAWGAVLFKPDEEVAKDMHIPVERVWELQRRAVESMIERYGRE